MLVNHSDAAIWRASAQYPWRCGSESITDVTHSEKLMCSADGDSWERNMNLKTSSPARSITTVRQTNAATWTTPPPPTPHPHTHTHRAADEHHGTRGTVSTSSSVRRNRRSLTVFVFEELHHGCAASSAFWCFW